MLVPFNIILIVVIIFIVMHRSIHPSSSSGGKGGAGKKAPKTDHYGVLGVEKDASTDQVWFLVSFRFGLMNMSNRNTFAHAFVCKVFFVFVSFLMFRITSVLIRCRLNRRHTHPLMFLFLSPGIHIPSQNFHPPTHASPHSIFTDQEGISHRGGQASPGQGRRP
jgi:hypothetical protein